MKSSEEMTKNLFERRKVYDEERNKARKNAVKTLAVILPLVIILTAVGIGVWQNGKAGPAPGGDVKGTTVALAPEATAPVDVQNETEPKETEPKETIPYMDMVAHEWPDRSLEEIVTGADLIVRAKNVGFEPSYYDGGVLYTDFLFEVVESYKGDRAVGDDVAVKCYGGFIGNLKTGTPSETPINEGQEYILILSHETDENDVPTTNDKFVYYPPRGILADDGTGVFTAQDPAISFTSAEFRDAISYTVLENKTKFGTASPSGFVSFHSEVFSDDIPELFEKSDLVVLGTVIRDSEMDRGESGMTYPLTDFEIEKVWKGDANPGDTVTFEQTGERLEDHDWSIGGEPLGRKGDRMILFLFSNDVNDLYGVTGCFQGKFFLDENNDVYSYEYFSDAYSDQYFDDVGAVTSYDDFISILDANAGA